MGAKASRRGARRAGVAAVLAFCLAIPASAGAATVAPIVGKWKSSGAVVDVTQTGPGSFQGKIVSGTFGACPGVGGNGPGGLIWNSMTGSGFSYSGTIPWVRIPECTPIGEGKTTFKLTSIDSGSLTSTSPDGSKSESASMTRVGTFPGTGGGEPKTTACRKNGKPVPCPAQKKLVKQLKKAALKQKPLLKSLKAAQKKPPPPAGRPASEDPVIKAAAAIGNVFLFFQGKKKFILGTPGTPPSIAKEMKQLKLPTKEQGSALAKKLPGDAAKMFLFGKQADKTLALNNNLVVTADQQYASNPAVAAELDTAAGYALTGIRYSQLSPEDRLQAAARVEGTLGTQFDFTNSAADLGIKGVKFANTTKGVKL